MTVAKLENPELKRVLGSDGNFGEQLGLTKDWVVRIVKAVGNYGEVFDRNLGRNSPLGIERGLNALWNAGGLHFAPPLGWWKRSQSPRPVLTRPRPVLSRLPPPFSVAWDVPV